jgi:hypothetical protein
MIINLWSTPRTGSVWYSFYLKSENPDSMLITELFNRYHMTIYHLDNPTGRVNVHEYIQGYYFEQYYLQDGVISKRKVYGPRTLDVADEEKYRIDLLMNADKNKKYVLHNHVEPMNGEIKNHLLNNGENYFIYRKDRRAQLGSYAIALATKQFAKFKNLPESLEIINDVPLVSLTGLLDRISVWDSMIKSGPILAYEDVKFESHPGWPMKQVEDYRTRLSPDILNWIDCQVDEYESSKID